MMNFCDIKNEKDRELYVELRQIIDLMVESGIKAHKNANHNWSECHRDVMKLMENELTKEILQHDDIPLNQLITQMQLMATTLLKNGILRLIIIQRFQEINNMKCEFPGGHV